MKSKQNTQRNKTTVKTPTLPKSSEELQGNNVKVAEAIKNVNETAATTEEPKLNPTPTVAEEVQPQAEHVIDNSQQTNIKDVQPEVTPEVQPDVQPEVQNHTEQSTMTQNVQTPQTMVNPEVYQPQINPNANQNTIGQRFTQGVQGIQHKISTPVLNSMNYPKLALTVVGSYVALEALHHIVLGNYVLPYLVSTFSLGATASTVILWGALGLGALGISWAVYKMFFGPKKQQTIPQHNTVFVPVQQT